MSRNSWMYLDDLRESWLFLLLGSAESDHQWNSASSPRPFDYWEFGIGNAESFVRTSASQVGYDGISSSAELAASLLDEMEQYRYQDTVLITPENSILQDLRRYLAASSNQTSLRGFRSLSLEDLLDRYFGQELRDYRIDQESLPSPRVTDVATESFVSNGGAERLWRVWTATYGLLPVHELEGEQI